MSSSVTCCTVSVIYHKAHLSKGPTDLKQKGTLSHEEYVLISDPGFHGLMRSVLLRVFAPFLDPETPF